MTIKRVPGVEILPTDPDVAACRQFCGHDFGKGLAEGPKARRIADPQSP